MPLNKAVSPWRHFCKPCWQMHSRFNQSGRLHEKRQSCKEALVWKQFFWAFKLKLIYQHANYIARYTDWLRACKAPLKMAYCVSFSAGAMWFINLKMWQTVISRQSIKSPAKYFLPALYQIFFRNDSTWQTVCRVKFVRPRSTPVHTHF